VTNCLRSEIDARGVARLTLQRPEQHNAFDNILAGELRQALASLAGMDEVRVVILSGDGTTFCAGADLAYMQSLAAADEARNLADALAFAELFHALDHFPKPTIARVNGHAFGGGVGLIACCDIAVAADSALFALTEVRMGLVPATISPYVLRAIGARFARRWFVAGFSRQSGSMPTAPRRSGSSTTSRPRRSSMRASTASSMNCSRAAHRRSVKRRNSRARPRWCSMPASCDRPPNGLRACAFRPKARKESGRSSSDGGRRGERHAPSRRTPRRHGQFHAPSPCVVLAHCCVCVYAMLGEVAVKIAAARAVVTGGASGLGNAVARHIGALGGKVTLLDIQAGPGDAAAGEIGNAASFVKCDVTSESEVNAAMQLARERMGSINLLVNCAGVVGAGRVLGRSGPMSGEFFTKVVHINLIGTFLCDKAAAAIMQLNAPAEDGERGVLIHTSSVAAFEGQIGQAAYSATKAAVHGMTLPIARELAAFGIRCVSIAPGIFLTPMVASMSQELQDSLGKQVPFPARLGKPQEFAQLVQTIFEVAMLNGTTIRLDGAIRMQPK
jgi:NAD(P)-dependent dehydrogenase (short-subunit alcohol dehydrogenase family)